MDKEKKLARNRIVLVIGILLVAANLRAPITALSPLFNYVRVDLSLSNTVTGFLTTLPLLAFAGLSPFVSKLAYRWGMEFIVFFATCLMVIGSIIRPFGGIPLLLFGTLLIGFAIAVGNVLLPSLIKKEFPFKMGLMTGMYSISMNVCAMLASGLSVPIAVKSGFGWQGALVVWSVFAIIALLFWLPQLKYNQKILPNSVLQQPKQSIWTSPLAWKITLFMGMQSTIFYVMVAWLPPLLISQGMDSTQAGFMLSLFQLGIIPFTFIVPIIASKMKSQRPIVTILTVLLLSGTAGLLFGSGHVWLIGTSVFIMGVASGAAFSVCMMFFSLRTSTAAEAADLSGMAQSIGYLLAAAGPTLFGGIHDMTASYTIPLAIIIVAAILLFITGMDAGRDKKVFGIRR
ncbi:CynX/NimT family MFS transporter [Paenilisteria rocourtiae]|uniref:CP family cyanate transporter-like MFS transporter n=1 Tax=Listeria rocourtiae TaxID=647910 RepID=A0A4V3DQA8_9LIST|nr:MFS transporter [Listeria rocourtiae]MBC1603279.1 MFS transporter [Listeria rocourtiae]TDR55436.1 CP family cyanate transporter-like MFS transporter [Listeria rocourtiae]